MSRTKQRLASAMNQYYLKNKKKAGASACDFSGAASTKAATSASGSCASQIKAAGSAGTGTISGGPVASTGGAGSGTTSTSKGVAAGTVPQAVFVGSWQAGAYLLAAIASGAFMVML